MIAGYIPLICAADPAINPPTKLGATLAIRFGYVNVLEYFLTQHRPIFLSAFKDDLDSNKSFSIRPHRCFLSWWKHGFEHHSDLVAPPKKGTIAEAIDGASRGGQVASLDWWLSSGQPLEYTEAALEYASAKNEIAVLAWWQKQYKTSSNT